MDKKSRCALWYNMIPELSIPFFSEDLAYFAGFTAFTSSGVHGILE